MIAGLRNRDIADRGPRNSMSTSRPLPSARLGRLVAGLF